MSIIIVNWNSVEYLVNCIRSIREQTHKVSYEIIVVDNASFDGCGERLSHEFPDVIFIQSPSNLGFAAANNLGASRARGSALLFLNPDTEVLNGSLDCLYEILLRLSDAGVVGGRLLNSDGSVQISCVQPLPTLWNQLLDAELMLRLFPNFRSWRSAISFENQVVPCEVEVVSGACMMLRKPVFESVGGFSEDYFMYSEDLDLCYKARNSGFRNYHVPDAVFIHHGGCSSGKAGTAFSNIMMRESVSVFLAKSKGNLYSRMYKMAMAGAAAIRLAIMLLLIPAYLFPQRKEVWDNSFFKWVSILRWGVGGVQPRKKFGVKQNSQNNHIAS